MAWPVRLFNMLTMAASIVLLFSISIDVLSGHRQMTQMATLRVQLIVCTIFMIDFFLRLSYARRRWLFFWRNILLLAASIPIANILHWMGADQTMTNSMILRAIPLLRGFYGLWIVVQWIASRRSMGLLMSYLVSVVFFTYLSALLFYYYELGINPKVDNFGNCFWWAWMSVTTVGAEIFAVTAIGKTLSVLLPCVGMMMFPIFTVYVTDHFQLRHKLHGKDTE